MNDYEQNELEELFIHAECMIRDYQEINGYDSIKEFEAIVCTGDGTIAFTVESRDLMYEMGYEETALMQYCTDNNNKWTEKIHWLDSGYWADIRDEYVRIEDYD